jgi:ABC-type branched-subunit amino acid transport system ATPase component
MVLESGGVALRGTRAELISNPHVRHGYLGG